MAFRYISKCQKIGSLQGISSLKRDYLGCNRGSQESMFFVSRVKIPSGYFCLLCQRVKVWNPQSNEGGSVSYLCSVDCRYLILANMRDMEFFFVVDANIPFSFQCSGPKMLHVQQDCSSQISLAVFWRNSKQWMHYSFSLKPA